MKYQARLCAVLVCATSFMPIASWAQSISGDLLGRVMDQTGAAVTNANVTVTNTATNIQTTTQTNISGEYRFGNLPPGHYNVSASATGFATATLKNLSVVLNQAATANLTLEVSSTTTTVNVSEAAVTIDTTTA